MHMALGATSVLTVLPAKLWYWLLDKTDPGEKAYFEHWVLGFGAAVLFLSVLALTCGAIALGGMVLWHLGAPVLSVIAGWLLHLAEALALPS